MTTLVDKFRLTMNCPQGVDGEHVKELLNNLEEFLEATRVDQPSLEPGLEGDYTALLDNIADGLSWVDERMASFNKESKASVFLSELRRFVYTCVQDNLNNQPADALGLQWFNQLENRLKTDFRLN